MYVYIYTQAISKTLGSRKGHPQIWEGVFAVAHMIYVHKEREREREKKKKKRKSLQKCRCSTSENLMSFKSVPPRAPNSIRSWMRASEWKSFMMAMTISRRLPHKVSICGGGYGYAKVTMAFNT